MNLDIDAFNSIKYVGLQMVNGITDYEQLRSAIEIELNNTTVRSARKPHLVYNTLRSLNDRFSNEIENLSDSLFPYQYFTCPVKCLSCGNGCNNSMGHLREGKSHSSNARLIFSDTNFLLCCCYNYCIIIVFILFVVIIGANSNVSMKTRYTYARDVIGMEMKLK